MVDKLFADIFFYDVNQDLQIACIEFGRIEQWEMMNVEHYLGLSKREMHLYLVRLHQMEEAFCALSRSDYLSELGISLDSSVNDVSLPLLEN